MKTDVPKTEVGKEIIHQRYKDLAKVENAFRVLRKKKLNNPWKKHDNIPL